MEGLLVHDLAIKCSRGEYNVKFISNKDECLNLGTHFIIDKNVVNHLPYIPYNSLIIEATEKAKSYENILPLIQKLANSGLKRNSKICGIGGGIIQDITCWVATTYMRGIPWTFVPTTLLAQADSCIGSKSSINLKSFKNILGSFNPPEAIAIDTSFLSTLTEGEIKSGLSEIVKLMIINGDSSDIILKETNKRNFDYLVFNALQIKKLFVEEDEFDRGIRNILNYGHCFGHAIESCTKFKIPHGVAVAMGMDIANHLTDETFADRFHPILHSLYSAYNDIPLNITNILKAMKHDKKNTSSNLSIIVPVENTFRKKEFSVDEIKFCLPRLLKVLER